jgi:glycosyl transferase family 87
VFLLALWATLVAGSALLAAACLRLEGAAFVVAVYVLAAADLVGATELLSLVHGVRAEGYLAVQVFVAGAALAFWLRLGRPRPRFHLPALAALLREPVLLGLGAAVGLAFAYEAFLGIAVPPNNWDALAYHLSRAAAWYQGHAVGWIQGAHTDRQNVFPPNGEIEILSTFAFVHGDRLAALPQFFAQLALLPSIYLISLRVGFGRCGAALAALLTATLTQVALQATTTQNDLVVASFVAATFALLLGRRRRELPIAAVALGLALGTKLTALFVVPLLVILALVLLPRRRLAELAVCAAVAFAAFGSFGYVSNLRHTGSVFGASAEVDSFRAKVTVKELGANVARDYWRFIDFSGYRPDPQVLEGIWSVGLAGFEGLGLPAEPPWPNTVPNEDISYFGPLGMLLVVPLSLLFVITGLMQRTSGLRFALALALPLFVLELSLLYSYNAFVGRFLLIPVVLTMPLAAWLQPYRLLSAALATTGIVTLAFGLALNHAKPAGVDGSASAWSLGRAEGQSITRPGMREALVWLEQNLPSRARVGVLLGADDWDYPLHGPNLARTLVPLPDRQPLREARRLGLRWVVLSSQRTPTKGDAGWTAVSFSGASWTVLSRTGRQPEAAGNSWGQTRAFRATHTTAGVRPVPFGACRLRLGSDPCLSSHAHNSWGQTRAVRGVSPTAGVRPLQIA